MLHYITGNPNKIASAKEKLGNASIEFTHKELDLLEIQSETIEEVAEFKAKQAFNLINSPVIVHDAGWEIPVLNGFPGPYMHHIHKWLTNEDFLKLMEDKKERTIKLKTVLVYQDGNTTQIFSNHNTGEILLKPKGEGRIEFDKIISFRKDRKSIAECIDEDLPKYDNPVSIWDKFIEWYTNY